MKYAFLILIIFLTLPALVGAETPHNKNYCTSCTRDSHKRIERSNKALKEFKHSHPCPSTGKTDGSCPGYAIDHIKPLKRGGEDAPNNMQWQTKEAAKEKINGNNMMKRVTNI